MSEAAGWWPVLASAAALSLALVGDALIYAVLPLHAAAFGVGLAWVGVLLSVNRFVRVFTYGYVARLTAVMGMRRTCVVACLAAVASTAAYGIADGPWILLIARITWGIAFAALVLVSLGYAVAHRRRAGVRVGWSRAIQHVGPVVALLAGTWLTQVLGPRAVFPVLAVLSLAALPLAWSLPRDGAVDRAPRAASVLGRPGPLDGLFFVHGFGVDGVFAVSITLLIAERSGAGAAILSGGALLAARHVIDAVAGPVFGALGDRHGATLMLSITVVLSAMGFAGVAFGATVVGALVMLVFRGAAAALGPSAVVQAAGEDDPVMGALARMQAWRDLGAAVGPLVTGLALVSIPATVLHAGVAALLVLVLGWWRVSRRA